MRKWKEQVKRGSVGKLGAKMEKKTVTLFRIYFEILKGLWVTWPRMMNRNDFNGARQNTLLISFTGIACA